MSDVLQEGEALESFSMEEKTIPMKNENLVIKGFPTEAPILTPFGVDLVKIYAMRRDGDKVLFGIGNKKPPILGWEEVGIFYSEWPD